MADYDSRPETLAHIKRVAELLAQVEAELQHRGQIHDASKLVDPELETFNEYTDWKAATERHADGDLARSLRLQKDRFDISDQLAQVLWNTAEEMGWLPAQSDGSP